MGREVISLRYVNINSEKTFPRGIIYRWLNQYNKTSSIEGLKSKFGRRKTYRDFKDNFLFNVNEMPIKIRYDKIKKAHENLLNLWV